MRWRSARDPGRLAAVGVGAALWFGRPKPLTVEVVEVGRGSVAETVTNTRAGTVKARRRSALSMPGGGRVELLHVKEGEDDLA